MEKKKIGIFTYMLNNYGAVLQAYALQRYLRNNCDHRIEVINFTTEQHLRDDRVFKKQSQNPIKNFILSLWIVRHYSELARRRKRTHEFKEKFINFSRRYSTPEEIYNNPPEEDVYVTGSDQVFNLNSSFADVYYLKFPKGNAKKIAYAPSFGIAEFDDSYEKKILDAIKDFDFLSCRDKSGASFLSKITGENVPVVLDPTLLLGADEWKSVAKKPTYNNYICVYDLNGKDNLIKIARQVKKKTGLKIACITSNLRQHYDVDKIVYDAGPSEFLGWFANADYVVTDSFHGTSFSIIFNKPFTTFIATPKTSDRIYTLLEDVQQKQRIVEMTSLSHLNTEDLSYEAPNADLDILRGLSIDYIKRTILK